MNDVVRTGDGTDTSGLNAKMATTAQEKTMEAAKGSATGETVPVPAPRPALSPAPAASAPAPPSVGVSAAPVTAKAPAAAPADAVPDAPQSAKADDAKKQRLAAAQARFKASKTKPALFVLGTLAAWWVLSVLGDIVITCVPGGAACRAPQLVAGGRKILTSLSGGLPLQLPAGPQTPTLTRYDWGLLILALLAAVWVAKSWVYPDADDGGEFTDAQLEGKADLNGKAVSSGKKG